MQDIAIVLLVIVTAYYAWQVRRSVAVMDSTRRADHTPRFGMQVVFMGPRWGGIRITNVGPGAAVNVNLWLKFIPFDHIGDAPAKRAIRLGIAETGRRVQVQAPCNHTSLTEFCSTYRRVELEGTAEDSLGNVYNVFEVLEELQAFSCLPHNGVEYSVPSELSMAVEHVAHELAFLRLEISGPPEDDLVEADDQSQLHEEWRRER